MTRTSHLDRGPFNQALDTAIRHDAQRPQTPITLCGHGGCPLAAGHTDRSGTDHLPPLDVDVWQCVSCGHAQEYDPATTACPECGAR